MNKLNLALFYFILFIILKFYFVSDLFIFYFLILILFVLFLFSVFGIFIAASFVIRMLDRDIHPRVLKTIGREDAVAAMYGRETLARLSRESM
jgi:hypothetical protein